MRLNFRPFNKRLKQPVAAKSKPAKDPMDWKLTENIRKWWTDQYCPQCKSATSHSEHMSDICNGCGYSGHMAGYRSSRQIWNGERWVVQRKYGNGPEDYDIEATRL